MKKKWILLLLITISFTSLTAQDALYPNTFPLGDVRITAGPFKHACDLNVKVLLQYDTDRLLAPFLREAGLPKKAETYGNWEKDGLDGHIGGHYLTALAIHYAATGNLECKKRMDYMVSEFARVQQANGDGSICGFPNSKKFAEEIRKGNVGIVWNYWVAWYNMHKTYAGLRDAWLYGKNEKAKKIFLKFCDWGVDVISNLDDRQMERMLDNEFGGMNEVYADAWQMTGNPKYLDTAKRFSHKQIFDSMARRIDNLDNKHANTQVPKAVGYQRVAELNSKTAPDYNDFMTAAEFFWETVVSHRSLSLGGNSRGEHFPEAGKCSDYMHERQGPESCNKGEIYFTPDPQKGQIAGKKKFEVGDTAIYYTIEKTGFKKNSIEMKKLRADKSYTYYPYEVHDSKHYPTLIKHLAPNRPSVAEKASSREWVRMRLGETYLIAAEAAGRKGDFDLAAKYINVIRERAAWADGETKTAQYWEIEGGAPDNINSTYDNIKVTATELSTGDFVSFILDERGRELLGEICRWEDLVRTEKFYEWVKKYNSDAEAAIKPYHKLRPIPQTHIDRLDPVGPVEEEQNEGYY